jgi:hypothetical protein
MKGIVGLSRVAIGVALLAYSISTGGAVLLMFLLPLARLRRTFSFRSAAADVDRQT